MSNELNLVGQYSQCFNERLQADLPILNIYASDGLQVHIQNRHPDCIKYFPQISDIIKSPDYIGRNPSEPNSIELVKVYDQNIMIGIKLDTSENYYYVATLFDIKQSKIERRLNSGRLIKSD